MGETQGTVKYEKPPVKGIEIFGYGFGGLAVNLLMMVVSNYIIFFFTDVAGIAVGAAGVIFTASKLVDAFTDPIMGTIIDNTTSRWGRMRPYMMFGCFTAVLSLIALFTSVSFNPAAKLAYYFIIYCVWSITFTIVAVPYQSSVSLVTDNKNKRNLLVMSGKLVAVPAGLVVANVHKIVAALGGGQTGWQRMAMVMGALIIFSLWICAAATRRFDTQAAAKAEVLKKSGQKYTVKERVRAVTTNKPLLCLVIAFGTNNLAQAATQAVQSYYAKYVLEDLGFIARVGNISSILMIPLFILVPILCRKFRKRNLFIIGTVIHLIPAFFVAFYGLNAGQHQVVVEVMFILSAVGNYFCNILAFMMVPDCIDFARRLTGIISAALITSTFTFCNKLSTAIGGFIISMVLQRVGYTADIVQPAGVLMVIVLSIVIPTLFSDVCSLIAMVKYPVNELQDASA